MGPGATLDKRRPDLRDELGYIAPPNRKLPPVPGSNYNTCDRIKRGTVISKYGPYKHFIFKFSQFRENISRKFRFAKKYEVENMHHKLNDTNRLHQR